MKKLILLLILTGITKGILVAQKVNYDSLKIVILKELNALMDQQNQEISNKLVQMEDDIKLIKEENDKKMSNEAISALVVSSEKECLEKAGELFEDREEKLLKDLENLINQRNKNLKDEIVQMLEEYKNNNNENTQMLSEEIKSNVIKETNITIDKKSSEIYSSLSDKITAENKALQKQIEEQNNLILELKKKVEDLEQILADQKKVN